VEATDLAGLYDQWAPRLLAYMMTLTRDRSLAEDALQNLFVKLATLRPALREPSVYLFRAARNEARRVSRRRPERGLFALDVIASREGEAPGADRERLAGALDRLPPEQSEVVLLHALEDLGFREIGEVLGIPADTAASRYRYGIEKLKDLLKP
jgi:RNA polymerase sigma-70 factor (ECF subfamily)